MEKRLVQFEVLEQAATAKNTETINKHCTQHKKHVRMILLQKEVKKVPLSK